MAGFEFDFQPNTNINFQVLERNIGQRIGSNLSSVRRAQGLTSNDVAQRIGIKPSTYHSYETGIAMVPTHVVAKWASVMGVPPHFVMKNTAYSSLIPQTERGVLLEKLQPHIGRQTMLEFEIFVRDICLFSKQDVPDFNEVERLYGMLDVSLPKKVSDEVDGDLYGYIAENVRSIRNNLQLSKQSMAELMQVSDHIYRRIEDTSSPNKLQIILSPRWWLATGIHPLNLVKNSKYSTLRSYQGARLQLLSNVLDRLNKASHQEIINFAKAMTSLRRSISVM